MKSFAHLFMAFALVLAGCEDTPRPRRGTSSTDGSWYFEADFSFPHQCTCSSSRPMYLKNGMNFTRSVTLIETANFVNRPSENRIERRKFTVPANGLKFLQCSIATTYSTCDTTYSWQEDRGYGAHVRGTPAFGRASGVLQTRLWALQRVVLPKVSRADQLSCKAECLGGPEAGPSCLIFHNPSDEDTPEHRLLAAVRGLGPSGTATRQQLLSAWGKREEDEPCGRGAAVTRSGQFSNVGGSCVVSGSFGVGGESNLLLPEQIVGQFTAAGDGFGLAFPNANAAPSLQFQNPHLNSVYGGQIHKIEQTRGHFVVSAGSACLALKL